MKNRARRLPAASARWLVLAAAVQLACGQSERNPHGSAGTAGTAGAALQASVGGASGTATAGGGSAGSASGGGGMAFGAGGQAGAATDAGRGGALVDQTGGQGGGGGEGQGGAMPEWDLTYAQWPMPNPVGAGLPNPASYATTAGVVHDNVTGLDWQRLVPPPQMSWQQASSYCAALTLEGLADWRLPSRIELVSIVDYLHVSPSIDSVAFPDTPPELFWTLTVGDGVNDIREVSFDYGKTDWISRGAAASVRCVRAEPPGAQPPPRYILSAQTALDTGTGLMWERVFMFEDHQFYTFAEAPPHCDALTLGGFSDWRVPSIKELQTLAFEGKYNPAIDPVAFPSATPDAYDYWSSNAHPERPGWAFNVRFSDGTSESIPDGLEERVLCVR